MLAKAQCHLACVLKRKLRRVDDMGMDEEGFERGAFDDMMDMNVSLSREELVVANAALSLSKNCMQVLKVGSYSTFRIMPLLPPLS